MEMSFLGCIGHLRAGSGLKELLEVMYASNAVDNMLTGKCNGDLKEAASLFDNLMSLDKTIEEVCSAEVLCRIRHMIERQKEALKQ